MKPELKKLWGAMTASMGLQDKIELLEICVKSVKTDLVKSEAKT